MRVLILFSFLIFSASAWSEPKKLVILGDSLTEGYGVAKEKAWPALLQTKLDTAKKGYQVVNAGVSGSTSSSGPSRMTWQLKNKPAVVLLALGANDGLRGLSVKFMEDNLNKTLELAKSAGVKVILAGMKMPPNYGRQYSKNFAAAFKRVAQKQKVPFIPFLLENVGGIAELNLTDGIHPNEKGHAIIAEHVFKAIGKEL